MCIEFNDRATIEKNNPGLLFFIDIVIEKDLLLNWYLTFIFGLLNHLLKFYFFRKALLILNILVKLRRKI